MKQYKVGLVGIGAVGTEMIKILRQRNFPASEIRVLATRERDEVIAGETFHVLETTPEAFEGLDIVLFAGTEGSKGASKMWGKVAIEKGAIVIDNGDDFRMVEDVPLVVPEINADDMEAMIRKGSRFIANPNCSTIITLMGIAALHRVNPLRHMTAVTFQSVSGAGRAAIDELDVQMKQVAAGEAVAPKAFAHQIVANVIPQIGGPKQEMPGFTTEEAKLTYESRKILGAPDLKIACTCVRVPIARAHSESLNLEFENDITPAPLNVLSRWKKCVTSLKRLLAWNSWTISQQPLIPCRRTSVARITSVSAVSALTPLQKTVSHSGVRATTSVRVPRSTQCRSLKNSSSANSSKKEGY